MSIENLAAQAGIERLCLPAYCPDLMPIEPMFSKAKAHLRKAAALTRSALSHATKEVPDAVTLPDIQGFFTTLGFQRQQL